MDLETVLETAWLGNHYLCYK